MAQESIQESVQVFVAESVVEAAIHAPETPALSLAPNEVVPLLIMTKLEEFDYQGATAIALVMLVLSFAMLFGINLLQRWSASRYATD